MFKSDIFLANQILPIPVSLEPLINNITGWDASFTGYHVAGDSVVWSRFKQVAYLYSITTGLTRPISLQTVANPTNNGSKVVWTVQSTDQAGIQPTWSIQVYDVNTTSTSTIVEAGTAEVNAWAIIGQTAILYTVEKDHSTSEEELYVSNLAQTGLLFSDTNPSLTTVNTCNQNPVACGLVRRDGRFLYDNGGQWKVGGVQFILPGYGINDRTFLDNNYNASTDEINCWLDVASGQISSANCASTYQRGYLKSNMVRIFVRMGATPGDAPTSYATICNIVRRANARRMRVGLVFWQTYSGGHISMSPERETWLNGLLDYLSNDPQTGTNWLPVVAYANAENEINEGCNVDRDPANHVDCYDANAEYIDEANRYVAEFKRIFKDPNRSSQIPITVGMSTELPQTGPFPPIYNYGKFCFRNESHPNCTNAPILHNSIDFWSPHNYGGGGYSINEDVRYNMPSSYRNAALVLEEYGYPTDSIQRNPKYREGCPTGQNPFCNGRDPLTDATAYVETNLLAIRERDYAGGVAFMLADMATGRNCNASDVFTGLFAVGGPASYTCGGTFSKNEGQPKATAYLVQRHHCIYLGVCP